MCSEYLSKPVRSKAEMREELEHSLAVALGMAINDALTPAERNKWADTVMRLRAQLAALGED